MYLFKICLWLLDYVRLPGAVVGSYIIAAGFLLAGGRRQFGLRDYWRRVRPGSGWLLTHLRILRHFASFGRVLCDRLLVSRWPDAFAFTHRGGEHLHAAMHGDEGCILLAAHCGNWELSGFRLRQLTTRPVHLVMIRDDLPDVQASVDRHMRPPGVNVIDPRDAIGAALAIHAALGRGEAVCMLGDRVYPGQPEVSATFFGTPARFPVGPFHAAAITGKPIIICFMVKVGFDAYRLEVDPPWRITVPPRGPARTAALQRVVQQWATRLERQVRKHPMQWHNFYHFWG